MLYISGLASRKDVYVTDTDDNVTERISRDDLLVLIRDTGLEVKGAELNQNNNNWLNITPYSLNQKESAKFGLVYGLNVSVSNGTLTRLCTLDGYSLNRPIKIRLSDYCNYVENYAIKYIAIDSDKFRPIFVIDDKVQFNTYALKDSSTNIIYDISEVTDSKIASVIYRSFSGVTSHDSFLENHSIVDNNTSRITKYAAEAIVLYGYRIVRNSPNLTYLATLEENAFSSLGVKTSNMRMVAYKKYHKQIEELFKMSPNTDYNMDLSGANHLEWLIRETLKGWNRMIEKDELNTATIDNFFQLLPRITNLNRKSLNIARNYLVYLADYKKDAYLFWAVVEFFSRVTPELSQYS